MSKSGTVSGGYSDIDYATAYLEDGVFGLGKDRLGYWLELSGHNYDPGQPGLIRSAAHDRAQLWATLPVGTHQLFVVSRDRDIEASFRRAMAMAQPGAPGTEALRDLLALQAGAQAINSPYDYQGILGIFPDQVVGVGQASILGLGKLVDGARLLSRDDPRPRAREVAQTREAGERLASRVAPMGGAGLAGVGTLRWLLDRHTKRGIQVADGGATQGGYGGQVEQLAQGAIREDFDHLEITLRGRDRAPQAVVAVLVMSQFPDSPNRFPDAGNEWLLLARHAVAGGAHFPVDVCAHVEVMNSDDIRKELRDIELNISNGERDVQVAGKQLDAGMQRTLDAVRVLQEQLRRTNQNMFRFHGRLVVWAPVVEPDATDATPEQALRAALNTLQDRVAAVIDSYKSIGITVVQPAGIQKRLLAECLPGASLGLEQWKQWGCLMPAMTLGQSMHSATQQLGDDEGPQIGWIEGYRVEPLRRDIFRPIRERVGTLTAITGAIGSGKSFFLYYLSYLASLAGAMVLIFDQKREANGLVRSLRLLGIPARVVRVSGTVPGQLDFCSLLNDPGEQRAAIESACQILCGERWKDVEPVITYALGHMYGAEFEAQIRAGHRPPRATADLIDLIDVWARTLPTADTDGVPQFAHPVVVAQQQLRKALDIPVARAIFGRPDRRHGDQTLETGLTRGLTVLQFDALQPPEPGVPMASQPLEKRLAGVLVHGLSIYARQLLEMTDDVHTPKICAIDEQWMFSKNAGIGSTGFALLNALVRLGSAKGVALYVASQAPKDLTELGDQISEVIAFTVTAESAAKDTLTLLGLPEDSPQYLRIYAPDTKAARGRIYMRDYRGRTGPGRIEAFDPELRQAFDTHYGRSTNLESDVDDLDAVTDPEREAAG